MPSTDILTTLCTSSHSVLTPQSKELRAIIVPIEQIGKLNGDKMLNSFPKVYSQKVL